MPLDEPREFERHLVVITAAVATALGPNAIIRSVERNNPLAAWIWHGRTAIHTSHNLPRLGPPRLPIERGGRP